MNLIDGRADKDVEAFVEESHGFGECQSKVKYFDALCETLDTTLAKEINLGMFELHCEDLIQTFHRRTTVLRDQIVKRISSDHQEENKKLCAEFEAISSTALSSPDNTDELVKLKEKVEEIRTVTMKEKEVELNKAAQRLVFLADYLQFTTAEMKLNTKTFQWHAKMPKVFQEHESIIKEKTNEYQGALKLRRQKFVQELEASNAQVDEFYTYGDVNELSQYMKKAQVLNNKLSVFQETISQFNMEEGAFSWDKTSYPLWQETVDKLKPFLGLYETSMAFVNKQKTWFESPMGNHDPKDIEAEVNSSWDLVSRLETEFVDIPSAKELVVNVRMKIEEFKAKMPVIRTLGNPGFRDRHWENVSNTVGFPVKGGSNLFQILDMGLDEYVAKFEKISDAATKEFNLEKAMKQMVDDWADMEFTFSAHGDTSTYTLSSVDSIQVLLDDHIVQTQTMQNSPFIKPFETQIGKWEGQLLMLQEIMDEWLKVQSIWLYLEPIFGSPDIMAQMPEEGRRFTTVDKNWRDIMKAAIVDNHVLQVAEIDRILEKLKKSNELLDLIGKGLNDYFETKRKCFPRFFFLSNSELLEILSETKDPKRIQPHLNKCFEGIASLEFDGELQVTAMCSITQEIIPLSETISTSKARGQVDLWLRELEVQMRESLRNEISRALKDYCSADIGKQTLKHPAQAVLCSNFIMWTSKIQKQIEANVKSDAVLKENKEFMSLLVTLVLEESCPEKCRVFANLILSQGYFQGILEDFSEKDVDAVSDFSWLSRVRYYYNKENCVEINMMHSKIKYGYEYLCPYTKLVMTSLTERCYLIMLTALDLKQGGMLSGETATGKTETIKDLAKAVAKQIVGFNCSEDFHHRAFAKFLKGLASCGAWSCFDEFHRIDTRALSVIAQQILDIQRALHSKMLELDFESSLIQLNPDCALFVTTDSLQHDTHIPDNLKVLFRPVAMANPDLAMIAELLLTSYGFKEATILSQKVACMVDLCDGLLSSQPHYEFGLRSMVSVLRSARDLKKTEQSEEEHHLISKALQTVKYCELLPQDQGMFKDILSHLFHHCPPQSIPDDALKNVIIEQCSRDELESTPYFLSKVQQLYDMLSLSDGVMLLGDPYGGKTKAWKTLAAALAAATDAFAPACIVLNPKSIQIDQLYGFFENDEWKDGILARSFRQFSSMPREQRKWLVFDGPVDSEWIESMNTVLDENKKLCLMSGEIIQLPPKTNLIFEAQDVESASPATVTRCGVLYMDPQCLHWNLIVKVWLHKSPPIITEDIKEFLAKMFERFCVPLLGMVKKYSSLRISEHHLISSLLNLFDSCLQTYKNDMDQVGTDKSKSVFEALFLFCCVWSIGTVLDTEHKDKFDSAFRQLNPSEVVSDGKTTTNHIPIPADCSIFDYKLNLTPTLNWVKWDTLVDTSTPLPREIFACQLIIPNSEQAKYEFLMKLLVCNGKPFILVGESGTGKSVYIRNLLQRQLDKEQYVSTNIFFTNHSSPTGTQDKIMSKLDKRRKGVYGPPLGKKFIVFVDDINATAKDGVDSQPPIELLRQLVDHGIWYDNKELSPIKLIEITILGTMRPPDGSSNSLSGRFFRHFNTLLLDRISDEVIVAVYSRVLLWHLDTKGFSKEFDPCINQIVTATLFVHKFIAENMLPTPNHTHYVFSLKEFSRVICGVLLSAPETMTDLKAMKRLWFHEVTRVYCDRLVFEEDCSAFLKCIEMVCGQHLDIDFNELNTGSGDTENDLRRPLLFADFMDMQNSSERLYKEVADIEYLRTASENLLVKYNEISRKPMNLVLFDFALEHLCRLHRVLIQPESHVMVVGVGGSGRQSLSRLAAYIAGFEFHEVEMSKDDGIDEWRKILKKILKKTTLSISQHVLFISDTQMTDDQFLEDINYLLYSGEVPILFSAEEKNEIIENMKSIEPQLSKTMHTDGSGPALLNLFAKRVKENMHMIFALSPFSDFFRRSIANFPALLNCCTINWLHQWPDDALNFVSRKAVLKDMQFKEGEMEACISLSLYFHSSTRALSKLVRERDNMCNYVTPASYLELNNLFKTLLEDHKTKVFRQKKMYEASLEKLKGAEGQVTVMQDEMARIQPKLAEASKELDSFQFIVEKDQVEITELEKVVKSHENVAGEKKKTADAIRAEYDEGLHEATTLYDEACDDLAAVQHSDLTALRGLKNPPISLKLNLEMICILKGVRPDRIADPSNQGKVVDDYWAQSKRLLGDPKFLEGLCSLDRENAPSKSLKVVREKYLHNPDVNPENVKGTNPSVEVVATAIYHWICALESYDEVLKMKAPKKEQLVKATAEYQKALEIQNEKSASLKAVQARMRDMNESLIEKKHQKSEYENEVDQCTRKLERAEQLISGFGGEREKWLALSQNLDAKFDTLTGDVLLAAGMVAYLGSFPDDERLRQIDLWKSKARQLNILHSEDWSLKAVLGNATVIQSWYMNGLLTDDFSTDNGIMLATAKRWVLMVDPQDIANKWIKTTEKNNNLTVLKQSDKEFLRGLENCIQFGSPVLLENVGECLDPALEPLLQKQTFLQGGSTCIKLGESTIEYSKNFRMYITTRLKTPHFPPETTAKIAMVNFSITTAGLLDQLLTIILARERPELEEERNQVSVQLNENKKNLDEIDHNILNVLFSSKGNILEDENAIKNLSGFKVMTTEISEKQESLERSFKRIRDSREEYLGLTDYAVRLFFTTSSLSSINHMYQFSLSWFINLFCSSIDLADKSDDLADRLKSVREHFLHTLFTNTMYCLFDEDRIIFAFLLACRLVSDDVMATHLFQVLLECDQNENLEKGFDDSESDTWMSDKLMRMLDKLCTSEKLQKMATAAKEDHKGCFREMWDSAMPQSVPCEDLESLQPFEKLVFLSHFRTDKMVSFLRQFVAETLGPQFVAQDQLDIGKVFSESHASTPIIFILGREVDPLKYIFRYAEDIGFPTGKLKIVTLGSGQEERAKEIIRHVTHQACTAVFEGYFGTRLPSQNVLHRHIQQQPCPETPLEYYSILYSVLHIAIS